MGAAQDIRLRSSEDLAALANPSCRRCYGRGYTGRNVINGALLWCRCVVKAVEEGRQPTEEARQAAAGKLKPSEINKARAERLSTLVEGLEAKAAQYEREVDEETADLAAEVEDLAMAAEWIEAEASAIHAAGSLLETKAAELLFDVVAAQQRIEDERRLIRQLKAQAVECDTEGERKRREAQAMIDESRYNGAHAQLARGQRDMSRQSRKKLRKATEARRRADKLRKRLHGLQARIDGGQENGSD